jgi:hypothetical protein
LTVLETLKNLWRTPKSCKSVLAQQPLGGCEKLDNVFF